MLHARSESETDCLAECCNAKRECTEREWSVLPERALHPVCELVEWERESRGRERSARLGMRVNRIDKLWLQCWLAVVVVAWLCYCLPLLLLLLLWCSHCSCCCCLPLLWSIFDWHTLGKRSLSQLKCPTTAILLSPAATHKLTVVVVVVVAVAFFYGVNRNFKVKRR